MISNITLTTDSVSPDAVSARPTAPAAEADGEMVLGAGRAGRAPELVSEGALTAQPTHRGLVPEHSGRTRDTRRVT